MKGKSEPKSDKDKAWRVMYKGKALTPFMDYALCVNAKKRFEGSGDYKGLLVIAQ